jgi:hypothetical protein
MEVHAHAHTERKKWTHYLWEFLMLFLAVFCGFLAENQREHIVEHNREKEFMKSMAKDLETDTTNFSGMIRGISIINAHIDSLTPLLSNFSELNKNAAAIYNHEIWLNLYYNHIYTDRTIEQLKNSGNFRLIRNKNVSDGIIEYDAYVKSFVINMQDEALLTQWRKTDDIRNTIFKAVVFKDWMKGGFEKGFENRSIQLPPAPYFLSTEKKQFDIYINMLDKYSTVNFWFIQNTKMAVKKAEALDSLIKEEYHLK